MSLLLSGLFVQFWYDSWMVITMCGSIKFMDEMIELQKQLEAAGHTVYMPIKADGVDYWAEDGTSRVEAKREQDLISKHMDKIQKSDAILVANYTKRDIEKYVGANTFAEMMYAHYVKKNIYMLNPKPDQPYIRDELDSMDIVLLDGDLSTLTQKP